MMYVAPDESSTKKFSHDYLSVRLKSPRIKKIISKLSRDDVLMKEVADTSSSIMLTYASDDATRTRGPSLHSVVYDETAGMDFDILSVIARTMDILPTKREIFAGTPLTSDNTLNKLWKRSHQFEWVMKCQSCNHWNSLTEDNDPLKMIQRHGLSCAKCSNKLNSCNGLWTDFNPGEREIHGFHLAQPMLPHFNQDPEGWKEIFMNCFNRDYSLLRVYNEVLGLPYDVGFKPITEEQLMKLCVLGPMNEIYRKNVRRYISLVQGVDWGVIPEHSRTVSALGGMREDGVIEIFWIKIYKNTDYEQQIRELADMAKAFQPILLADCGPDPIRGKMLGNLYDSTRTQLVQYREGTIAQFTDTPTNALDWSQTRWALNRSDTLTFTMELLKKGMILFPRWEDSSEAMQDILAVFTETREEHLRSRILYRHNDPDDFLHVLNYIACAAHLQAGNPFFNTV